LAEFVRRADDARGEPIKPLPQREQNGHVERFSERRAVAVFWSSADRHAYTNREAAAIVLSDVHGYGGEGAVLVRWARLTVARAAMAEATLEAA
jgi:hypothetical protein